MADRTRAFPAHTLVSAFVDGPLFRRWAGDERRTSALTKPPQTVDLVDEEPEARRAPVIVREHEPRLVFELRLVRFFGERAGFLDPPLGHKARELPVHSATAADGSFFSRRDHESVFHLPERMIRRIEAADLVHPLFGE